MVTQGRVRRAHLAIGEPWLDAAAVFLGFGSPDEEPWRVGDGIRAGDLIVTVLDTDPRLLLCAEEVDAIEDGGIVVGERLTLHGTPPVDMVERWAGVVLPTDPGPIEAAAADTLLRWLGDNPGASTPAPPGSAADAQFLLTLRSPSATAAATFSISGIRPPGGGFMSTPRPSSLSPTPTRTGRWCCARHAPRR
ncbi:hypothetical protein RHDE110596_08475 [Prescottella defluvii]|uniref:hypothetical protein n=1 Tax=Prescottella defluvii TaxID=1323361 RepID=UPI0012E09E8D|nr:hypothetical protein [Prescottella defluvii]